MTKKVNIITLCYFFFLLLIILIFGYTPFPDSEGYLILTRDCLQHGQAYPIAHQMKELSFIWNLGAINAVVVAHYFWGTAGTYVLLMVYAAMKAGCAWLIFRIAQRFFTDKVAFTAFLLYVIYPANWGEATSLLSEIPFTFFSLASVYLCAQRRGVWGGVLLAMANWFRPMALVFLLPMLLTYRRQALRLLMGYALCIVCIGGFNQMRTGHFL